MTKKNVPGRHEWLPSALPVIFGEEPAVLDPWPAFRNAVAAFAAQAGAIRSQALHDEGMVEGINSLLSRLDSGTGPARQEEREDFNSPMRVVLMGRTMAGKSSLLAALCGSHFDRIGDGRQRFSRDVLAATSTASRRIEVVDTPGVGARDGAEDFKAAFDAAIDADLILWVASSDSIQQETARALRHLGVIGKPIIVVLNCRQSLDNVGKLNLMRFPERVFGHREGLVDEIRRHMAAVAVEPLEVVYVHALAATESSAHSGEIDTELHAASRIDDLSDALNREYATHSESRRALRVVDGQRRQVDSLMLALEQGSTIQHARADHNRKLNEDVHARLTRVIRTAAEGMVADIAIAVGRRRDWHLSLTDFGESLQHAWDRELYALRAELTTALDIRFSQLRADVESTVAAADAEWARVSPERFALRGLTGFDSVLGNRLARAGIAAISAGGALVGAKLGAVIGSALGLPTGPGAFVTTIVGSIVGAGLGMAIKPLKRLADSWVLGKEGVLRKRRDEVAKQVGPLLDEFKDAYERSVDEQLDEVRTSLAKARRESDDRSAALDRLADQWLQHTESLGQLIRELDKATAAALLRIAGRERLAQSLKLATRTPGVCILAEFEDTAFSEAWLYPPDIGQKLASGRARSSGDEAAGALSYALGLVDAPARLMRADSASATIWVDADLPLEITETWSDALTFHISKHIRIESTRRTSES